MYCYKCGCQIPDDSEFCIECGNRILKNTEDEKRNVLTKLINKNKVLSIIVISFFIIVVAYFIISTIMKWSLKNELLNDWSRIEGDGTLYELVLDFSDNKIDYYFNSGLIDKKIATYDYEMLSGSRIKVKRTGGYSQIVTIEFNKDKTMMTMTPAITSTDASEYWFSY